AVALVTLLYLPAVSCVENLSNEPDVDTGGTGKLVPLRFSASVKGAGEIPASAGSRTIMPWNDPDYTIWSGDYEYDFTTYIGVMGMTITQYPEGGEIFFGSVKTTGGTLNDARWVYYAEKPDGAVRPECYAGKKIRVVFYGPLDSKIPGIKGLGFDFTGDLRGDDNGQPDYIYCDTTYVVPENGEPIELKMKHAFAYIRINVTKSLDKDRHKLSQVDLDNMGDVWIKNKGYINPATGDTVSGADYPELRSQAGPLSYGGTWELDLNDPSVRDFFVPAFMSDTLKDETVVIALTVNGKKKIFPLRRNHLNHERRNGKDYYGFAPGYKNTYNVVYDNTAMRLILTDWNTVNRDGDFGIPPSGVKGIEFTYLLQNEWNYFPTMGSLAIGDHRYDSWLSTVALGNNGIYVDGTDAHKANYSGAILDRGGAGDKNVYEKEKPSADFFMTQENVSTVPVPWEGADGALIAKELCRKYRGGGFTNWRLPRASEFRMIPVSYTYGNKYESLNFGTANTTDTYWTATEASATTAWTIYITDTAAPVNKLPNLDVRNKKTTLASVRCVRDNKK
ncbi:fimbrillin family protein, partial [Coprobacter tertius]